MDLPDMPQSASRAGPWHRDMNRYHWFVLIVACLGWLLDCLDQQLFTLARVPAMKGLLDLPASDPQVKQWGAVVTAIFLIGWATGGLIFGVLGDRIGRAKTMMLTIFWYSLFTGLSSISVSVYDFAAYRFLTGLGVGGEFAVGVALVAEAMPETARVRALGFLQAWTAMGNISAALISLSLSPLEGRGISAWRIMFVIGALPALLVLVIRRRLQEPERWQRVSRERSGSERLGSYRELFGHPTWRRHAIIGLLLASTGVIGLWGIGFFSADLARAVFRDDVAAAVYSRMIEDAQRNGETERAEQLERLRTWEQIPEHRGVNPTDLHGAEAQVWEGARNATAGRLTFWASLALIMQQIGAFFGMYAFAYMAQRVGRKPAFALSFLAAMGSTAMVFWKLDQPRDIFWMMPMMGFFQLSLFAGYAIYFAELFPTHLRSTGTSFCYNVGRFVAAAGPITLGLLSSRVFVGPAFPEPLPWRYAGVSMSAIFLVGLVVLPFAPETRGRPLPE